MGERGCDLVRDWGDFVAGSVIGVEGRCYDWS